MPHTIDLSAILALPVDQRIEIVNAIEDSIQRDTDRAELTDDEKAEMLRRVREHRADPSTAVPWEEVERRLEARFRS